MNGYTPKQQEYINSVDGNAHMSAVEIIGELEARHNALRAAAAKMRHANNKNHWDALEWIAACAEVDRLLNGAADCEEVSR